MAFRFLLLASFLLLPAVGLAEECLLVESIERFNRLNSYQATLRSYGPAEQIVTYRYQKPGFVRIDFVTPHRGAALVYRPDTAKVTLRPFGFSSFLTLSLKPTNRLVRSPAGHRVDQSDLGFLLQKAKQLALQGDCTVLGQETLDGAAVTLLQVSGAQDSGDLAVSRYLFWLGNAEKLPLRVESYDRSGLLLEGLLLEGLKVDLELGDIFTL